MKYSYYPGCTLKNKAKDLDAYARASAKALGFEMEEIEDWQCCGGVYPLGSDEIATKLSSVRALNDAKEKGECFHEAEKIQIFPYVCRFDACGGRSVPFFGRRLRKGTEKQWFRSRFLSHASRERDAGKFNRGFC